EGRHHQPEAATGEAAPAHRPGAAGDAGGGMEMAGDLALCRAFGRLAAENERAEREGGDMVARQALRRGGIVVAGDPDPVAPGLEPAEMLPVLRQEAAGA